MKYLLKTTFLMLLTATAYTSCVKEDIELQNEGKSPQKIELSGDIDQIYTTRVNDAGFCDGDAIGIYVTDYNNNDAGELLNNGNRADNVKHTFNESQCKWIPQQDIYWKDSKTHIDLYGYYPYSKPENVKVYTFELRKDQNTSASYGNMGGYEASDFLWGKTENVSPTDNVIKIRFQHIMASVRVSLVEGSGFEAGEWNTIDKSVLILNTKRKANINLSNGNVSATGDIPATGTIPFKNENDFRGIVIPQQIAANTPLLSITVGGIPYIFTKNEELTYTQSKQHNFTIKVNKRTNGGVDFELTSESITAWENDKVSHDATAREYIVIDVTTPGTLKEALSAAGKTPSKVKNLKVTGIIDTRDFYFMRDEMSILQALNLKEVEIAEYQTGSGYGESSGFTHYIPDEAFRNKKSLMRLVLPDKLTGIGYSAFQDCSYLVGSLIIPEGVTEIQTCAFRECKAFSGTLSLPTTLSIIGEEAFLETGFNCELILPSSLERIERYAFLGCKGFYGNLNLPDKLNHIGEGAFRDCDELTGSIIIPEGVKEIPDYAFYSYYNNGKFNGNLVLHDGITAIGVGAFKGTGLRGELILPKNLIVVNDQTFMGCDFSGELKFPEDLAVIGTNAFANNWRLSGVLNIPKDVQSIGASAFDNCWGLQGIIFEDGVETIGRSAFNMCYGIGSIVCKGTIPAYVQAGAFDGVPKDNFTLEVPESSTSQYQTAIGWSEFKRIATYRNLVIRPSMACAINTLVERDLILNADEDWSIESKPDWVTLDKMSGNGKSELKLTFSQMTPGAALREGEVIFKLTNKDYRTTLTVKQYNYQYQEDEVVTLQAKTKGEGINIVILGDGYDAKDISEGKYFADMQEAYGHFFNIEPYKSYKEYFNVYTAIAVSPESGIGGVNTITYNKFNTSAKGDMVLGGRNGESDYTKIFEYACNAPTVNTQNIDKTLIIIIPNTSDYGGICYLYDDGSAITYCPMSTYGYPYDFRGVIQHEAGGHGFGKLGDEYIYHNAFIDNCSCTCCPHAAEFNMLSARGWYKNLSLTGKMNEVPWSHLIFDDKYKQIVDIFEGGFMHTRGVYRSEQNSCMNNDIPYYSTICREEIVKRIKNIAGENYSFDEFKANDIMDAASQTTRSTDAFNYVNKIQYRHSPILMGKRPQ